MLKWWMIIKYGNPQDSQPSTNDLQMMQRNEYFPTFDSSSASSPSSERALSSSVDSRRSSKTMTERSTVPDKVEVCFSTSICYIMLTTCQRRREQNRQSQRAYRDRKEKHQRDLEGQVSDWKQKHEKLVRSCSVQTAEICQLKAQVAELNAQLQAIQESFGSETWSTSSPQNDFDMVPFFEPRQPGWTGSESLWLCTLIEIV